MSAPLKKPLSAATQRIVDRVRARIYANLGDPNDQSLNTSVIEMQSKPAGEQKSAAALEPGFASLRPEIDSKPSSVPASQDSVEITETPSERYGVYSLVSLKGGVGRTTSAMHLAAVVSRLELPVVVLEVGSEHSARRWATAAQRQGHPLPFDVVTVGKSALAAEARALSHTHVVIIDAPSHDGEMLIKATRVSDYCIVVVSPSLLDVGGLASTLGVLYAVQDLPAKLEIAILVTRCKAGTQLARGIHQKLKPLAVLDATIGDLEGYKHSFGRLPTNLEQFQRVWDELHEGSKGSEGSSGGSGQRPGFRARSPGEDGEDSATSHSQLDEQRRLI